MSLKGVMKSVACSVMVLVILLQTSAPLLATVIQPEPSAMLLLGKVPTRVLSTSWSNTSFNSRYAVVTPILEAVQKQVGEQLNRIKPAPVSLESPLPPGTVERQKAFHLYLPLLNRAGSAEERLDLRTRTTKVFQYPDGSGYAFSYMHPIHYHVFDKLKGTHPCGKCQSKRGPSM